MTTSKRRGKKSPEELWREALTKPHGSPFGWLPSSPRCSICGSPFKGVGGAVVRMMGIQPWRKNPTLCTMCYNELPVGGTEVDIAVLFADIRGSTALGEQMGPTAFAGSLNAFYRAATQALVPHRAIIDKFMGDAVIALFIPFSGSTYRQNCVLAAVDMMRGFEATASGNGRITLGMGLHAGPAFVGKVGEGEVNDFTALGDTVNTASRLQHEAAPGEIVLSEEIYGSVLSLFPGLESRTVEIRGKQDPMMIRILRGEQSSSTHSGMA